MTDSKVTAHYAQASLTATIDNGIKLLGKTRESITLNDLAPIDEFHIGGRAASIEFLDQLALDANKTVLDIGCGIGGASRFVADRHKARVSGIDLTQEYVETARSINDWLGLGSQIEVSCASATELPFDDCSFDCAFMMHVGMNIPDKTSLCAEISRVLKPGGRCGIYDVMRIGPGELVYPVPWAASAQTSAVADPATYRAALIAAGLEVASERNRYDFALEFFAELKAKSAAAGGPPPLGLHLLMGETAPLKMKNMIENISAGRIAPVELIATKR